MTWIALSDTDLAPPRAGVGQIIERGTLMFEFATPLAGPVVLIDYHASAGWHRALSLLVDPEFGICLLHRQGASLVRHVLSGPVAGASELARLWFAWDAPARTWRLGFDPLDGGPVRQAAGQNPIALPRDDATAFCGTGAGVKRHAALRWNGVAAGMLNLANRNWIGQTTPVVTPRGIVKAGSLQQGDMVLTYGGQSLPVTEIAHCDLPTRGSFAPIRLRAPYFSPGHDIVVTEGQPVLLTGSEVEYLFGDDEAITPARHLVDGRSALPENRRPAMGFVAITLERPALINCDGCMLASSAPAGVTPQTALPIRTLERFETVALQSLRKLVSGRTAV
jgi:hypothetical protein